MQNNIIRLAVIFLIILLNIPFLSGQENYQIIPDIKEIKEKIKIMAEKTITIESDFIQEKHLSMLEEIITSKGYFCYKKEDKIRWEYYNPVQYLIIINNGIFAIKDGDNISEYDTESNAIFKEINNIILNSVQGNILNNKDFNIKFYENSKLYHAELIPLKSEMTNFLSTINLYFDKIDLSVSKIKIIESSDDFTSITFFNKKLNEEVPDNKFSAR